MKKLKRIINLTIMICLIQLLIFALLDRQVEHWLNPSFQFNKAYFVNIDLKNSSKLNLSYNNKFLALMINNELRIIDLTMNTPINFQEDIPKAGRILGYAWLPDRNSLLYLTRDKNDFSTHLFSLNLDLSSTPDTKAVYEAKFERSINYLLQDIFRIEISTYTNNLYIHYLDANDNQQLIKIDIMKNINRVDDPEEKLLKMCVSNKFGNVYVQSKKGTATSIFSINDRERTVMVRGDNQMLLGCQNDRVYVGQTREDKLIEIWLYQIDSKDLIHKTVLWKGEISITNYDVQISNDNSLMILTPERLNIIKPDGKHVAIKIADARGIVLSDTGKMYMEIIPKDNIFSYYWRSIQEK